MNTPKIADYTTRKSYQQNYAKDNREAINARKRAWRKAKKAGAYDSVKKCTPVWGSCNLPSGHKGQHDAK